MANTTTVRMPQLGESVHEGTISKWLVRPGDSVIEYEPMLEVDTDKVNAEVPAPVTGILVKIIAKEGETVQAGMEIAIVEIATDPHVVTPLAQPTSIRSEMSPAVGPERGLPQSSAESPPQSAGGEMGRHRYSPAVQMQAKRLNVTLADVPGTGIGGRVTRKDVQDHAARTQLQPPHLASVQQAASDHVVPLTRVRQLIADRMTRSKATIPHAWQTQEVDMSGVVASRAAHRTAFEEREGFSLTYLPYVMAAAAAALREHRTLNSTFNDNKIVIHRDINLGISVGLEDTLVAPVVKRADGLSVAGLARALNDLVLRARSEQLMADDLAGATFTIDNSGSYGTLISYSVINPGQVAILSMEAIVDRPVAASGMIGIKPMMYVCLSIDHRVLDGLQAAGFLRSCRKWLESVHVATPIY